MILTDTHTHLYSSQFTEDRSESIKRAIDLGINRFFIPAIDSSYLERMYKLEKEYPENIFLMIGLHPCYVKPESYKQELALIEEELTKRNFYAIGEIGIDLYWDKSTLEIQKKAFRHQIQLAKKYKLPINIHCRDAFDEVFEILELEKGEGLSGIFHCFTGTYEQALKTIGYGLKLGIGGVATFKNGQIDQFLNQINLNHIVLETDAPYLAPTPYRGKRNESAYIMLIAQKLATLYNCSVEEIASITTLNSKEIFGI
ncbi:MULTISPECIES: TatD family hydrolase [Flavobacterium]|uniref:TatD family hydrolase n=2 Tax=Flavobacterium TaxID=237 RepID=A0ABW8PR14_9FLAO|nr:MULTISPECIES: TatD family hydrolase [Flavobacterium]QYS88196.1 TatD family hydrolase [Flavobacterium davisii]RVU90640.1 TatD family deoxyribonuclease [Flavobacterium columnare]SPE76311.1 putative deoxyribonuclease YcfH [Flavobacterium columnare]